MTETSLQTALGRTLRDPDFLGKCMLDIDAALEEAKLDLNQEERESLRDIVIGEYRSEPMKLLFAFKQANAQKISISDYLAAQREYTLDFSRKFSYDTIHGATSQMEKAFKTTLWMHTITFYTGIILIFASVYAAFIGMNLLAGFLGLGGLADVSYHFYKKPVEGVHRSIGNLVQLEAAFLGFINELGYWKFYEVKGDVAECKEVASALRELTAKTMELIDQYVERIPEELENNSDSGKK